MGNTLQILKTKKFSLVDFKKYIRHWVSFVDALYYSRLWIIITKWHKLIIKNAYPENWKKKILLYQQIRANKMPWDDNTKVDKNVKVLILHVIIKES